MTIKEIIKEMYSNGIVLLLINVLLVLVIIFCCIFIYDQVRELVSDFYSEIYDSKDSITYSDIIEDSKIIYTCTEISDTFYCVKNEDLGKPIEEVDFVQTRFRCN